MTYISKEQQKEKLVKLKPLFKKYGLRATLARSNASKITLNIWEGSIDFMGQYNNYRINNKDRYCDNSNVENFLNYKTIVITNNYTFKEFSGEALEFLIEVNKILQQDNYDRSDMMTDYFDIGFFVDISIGNYEKDYIFKPKFKKCNLKNDVAIIKKDELELVEYSEKALALFGNTKPIKSQLKELGGRFNKFLTHQGKKQGGWVFSKKKNDQLKLLLA